MPGGRSWHGPLPMIAALFEKCDLPVQVVEGEENQPEGDNSWRFSHCRIYLEAAPGFGLELGYSMSRPWFPCFGIGLGGCASPGKGRQPNAEVSRPSPATRIGSMVELLYQCSVV